MANNTEKAELQLIVGFQDFLGNLIGHGGIFIGFHSIAGTALGTGAEVGGVAEHLGEGNECVDHVGSAPLLGMVNHGPFAG